MKRFIIILWCISLGGGVALIVYLPEYPGLDIFFRDTYFVISKVHVILVYYLFVPVVLSVVTGVWLKFRKGSDNRA
jgi:hypothetical protein